MEIANSFAEAEAAPMIHVKRPPRGYVVLVGPDGTTRGISLDMLRDDPGNLEIALKAVNADA